MQRATSKQRQISCKRCQKRKIRCSRTSPCISCSLASAPCEYRDDGSKRLPISRDYVQSLEGRVAKLETFLAKLKAAPRDQRDSMIDNVELLDDSAAYDLSTSQPGASHQTSADPTAVLRKGGKGSLTYHGPTSIYNSALSEDDPQVETATPVPLSLAYSLDTGENLTSECIALFFRWQYPQFMFIDRQAFILDFQRRAFDGQFCSSALINAVCSIGALMSTDSQIRKKATAFSKMAVQMVMDHGLDSLHTTSVQTLLCCAFYEIGNGNLSKGWLYSGMAFRIGQDLGFHRDPNTWSKSVSGEGDITKEYRRRIYWGCYISDKFLSMMLGRPCLLHEYDADVRASQPQQQDHVYNNFVEERGYGHLKVDLPIVPRLAEVFNKQVEISHIIRRGLSVLHSPGHDTSSDWAEMALSELDRKLTKFKEELPADMRLKEWSSISTPVQTHLAALHMLWHSTRISIHHPFLRRNGSPEHPADGKSTAHDLSAKACLQSVERITYILKRFQAQYGLRYAPLVFVQGVIASVNTIVSLAYHRPDAPSDANLPMLEVALEEMASTWNVANEALIRLRSLLASTRVNKPKHSAAEQHGQHMEHDAGMHYPQVSGNGSSDTPRPTLLDDIYLISGTTIDEYFWDPFNYINP